MEVPIDHKEGQYRSQLFEELIYGLLLEFFSNWDVNRNVFVPKEWKKGKLISTPVDFVAKSPGGDYVLVEAKAPYTATPSYGINRILRRLKSIVGRFPEREHVKKIVLALASELPASSEKELLKAKQYFAERKIECEMWDGKRIKELFRRYLRLRLGSFSTNELELALGKEARKIGRIPEKKKLTTREKKQARSEREIKEKLITLEELKSDEYKNAIVICADFCSYSKFVNASGSDKELIISIMSRFYREVRKAIEEHGGIVDKFMGDGVLFYWIIRGPLNNVSKIIDSCISRLMGISMSLAEEWQDHLDAFVKTKGMRCGGAIGDVLLVTEEPKGASFFHAIGDCINLASRFISKASPNSLVISNRLKTKVFGEDNNFEEMNPLLLKNIGSVKAWKKNY